MEQGGGVLPRVREGRVPDPASLDTVSEEELKGELGENREAFPTPKAQSQPEQGVCRSVQWLVAAYLMLIMTEKNVEEERRESRVT